MARDREGLQPPTLGALGEEGSRSKRKGKKEGSGLPRKIGKDETGLSTAPSQLSVPPAYTEAPALPGFNLAGVPDQLIRSSTGIASITTKVATPVHSGNLNLDPFIRFSIHSSCLEWIRFKPDSLSLVIYAQLKNPNKLAQGTSEQKADVHAMRATSAQPEIFLDPSVAGTGFIQRVEVSICNVAVPTSSAVVPLNIPYTRFNRIFCRDPAPYFALASDVGWNADTSKMSKAMLAGTRVFDYGSWNSRQGVRIPVFLDGIFPFSSRNLTLQSIDGQKAHSLFFPPNVSFDIKVHLHRTKLESLFHPELGGLGKYFDGDQAMDSLSDRKLEFTFQSAALEYEVALLHPGDQVSFLNKFREGGKAIYDYDIPRSQHQLLTSAASYTENSFSIMPWCRLVYVGFIPSWGVYVMDNKMRPLSGLSTFPRDCSKIDIKFAGRREIIADGFERFGIPGEHNQISQKIFYDYLVAHRMTNASYDQFFPSDPKERSLIQVFPLDLRSRMSDKVESLEVSCHFAAGKSSPKDVNVVVISVHPNGRAVCSLSDSKLDYHYNWTFSQSL